jgi:hypothetical protein
LGQFWYQYQPSLQTILFIDPVDTTLSFRNTLQSENDWPPWQWNALVQIFPVAPMMILTTWTDAFCLPCWTSTMCGAGAAFWNNSAWTLPSSTVLLSNVNVDDAFTAHTQPATSPCSTALQKNNASVAHIWTGFFLSALF